MIIVIQMMEGGVKCRQWNLTAAGSDFTSNVYIVTIMLGYLVVINFCNQLVVK